MYYFIEPMTEVDIERVQVIERQSFSTPWSANTYRTELRQVNTSRYLVGRASNTPPPPRNNKQPRRSFLAQLFPQIFSEVQTSISPYPIIAYAGLWISFEDGHITTIAVDPAFRGRGVGELMLNGLIDQALETSAEQLTLEVRVSNNAAQRLYLKYGFKVVSNRPRYYTDNGEDALIMTTDPIRTHEYQHRLRELRESLYNRLRSEANASQAI